MPDLLQPVWIDEGGVVRRIARAPLGLLEIPYRAGAWLHRGVHRWGLRPPRRLPAHVVAIGNLTVGGSGKTPVTGWLASELSARGSAVAILSRGVRGAAGDRVNVVSDGDRVLCSSAQVGDEPVWLARSLRGIPVLAGRNRVALGLRAIALFGAEILLLDDGFQHHRVARDLDLVCIDAELGLGNGRVLPRGPLREPVSALEHADAILWTRVPAGIETPRADPRIPRQLPRFRARMIPRQLRDVASGDLRAPEALRGSEVGVFAAVARPDRLRRDVEGLGAKVLRLRAFPDHHIYSREDLESLDPALRWITTAKDAVKIPASWTPEARIEILEEEVQSPDRSALLGWIEERLEAVSAAR